MAVYVIGPVGGPYKVGYTDGDGTVRLAALQTGYWENLVLHKIFEGDFRLEGFLHGLYAPKRLRGEWFALDQDDIEYIDVVASAQWETYLEEDRREQEQKWRCSCGAENERACLEATMDAFCAEFCNENDPCRSRRV